MKTKPANIATAIPTTSKGILKALFITVAIEFDWVMFPTKPKAKTIARAKKAAKNLPKPPKPLFLNP